jgi:COMPASS component SWD2
MAQSTNAANGGVSSLILTPSIMVYPYEFVCTLRLTTCRQGRFKPSKVFTNAVDVPAPPSDSQTRKLPTNTGSVQITGLSFDDRGETLITAAGDETFRVYNVKTGT